MKSKDSAKRIGLAIAGGPNGGTTPILLDTLASLNQRSTFFLQPDLICRNPHIADRVTADGHDAGLLCVENDRPLSELQVEIRSAQNELQELSASAVTAFMDLSNVELSPSIAAARACGLKVFRYDYKVPECGMSFPEATAQEAVAHLGEGSIAVLVADKPPRMGKINFELARVLEELIRALRFAGYTVSPASSM